MSVKWTSLFTEISYLQIAVDVLFMGSITSLDARDFSFADDSCKFYAKTKVIYG